MLFYPRPDPMPPPPGAEDLLFAVAPGVSLGVRFYPAGEALPTILYFHGNGEVASDHDGIAPMYHAAGANLLVCEFRGYGRSGGRPSFAALVDDCGPIVAAFHEYLDQRGFGGARFVMGRSMGANCALEIAANHSERFAGLVIESGAGNVKRLVARAGLADADERAAGLIAGHEEKLRRIEVPTLIIHGERDELIPLPYAAELYGMLENSRAELLVISGAGHNDILWLGQREYFEAIGKFVGGAPR
jgi:pimeloyl-ACP methyl ester carboxylesterase